MILFACWLTSFMLGMYTMRVIRIRYNEGEYDEFGDDVSLTFIFLLSLVGMGIIFFLLVMIVFIGEIFFKHGGWDNLTVSPFSRKKIDLSKYTPEELREVLKDLERKKS